MAAWRQIALNYDLPWRISALDQSIKTRNRRILDGADRPALVTAKSRFMESSSKKQGN
jgi:hypothetical protein